MQLEGTNVRLQTFVLVFASLRSRVLNTIGVDTSTLFAINGVPAVLVCDASVGLQWRCWSWLSHDCGVACLLPLASRHSWEISPISRRDLQMHNKELRFIQCITLHTQRVRG